MSAKQMFDSVFGSHAKELVQGKIDPELKRRVQQKFVKDVAAGRKASWSRIIEVACRLYLEEDK